MSAADEGAVLAVLRERIRKANTNYRVAIARRRSYLENGGKHASTSAEMLARVNACEAVLIETEGALHDVVHALVDARVPS